ncbi:sulfite oxidase [Aquibaculum arenosum]|uniref:Sulfite oxidase n=1 Tax=Aquibaculum arenosum TaxID=3032591 RepID=A0ABT5YKC1_9PROT|nr:sulfite oxidase [Fodinicurvata sp. CAU 1616]MDF2095276.1 sulfite oxidase [Fodinicurvata sp. CAU 1616]
MPEVINLQRRYLLAGTAATAVAAGTFVPGANLRASEGSDLPEYVNWKEPETLIIHSDNTLETKRSAFGTASITPEDRLYIRNNISPPPSSIVEDRDSWEVSIEGVAEPRTLTLAELKTMGIETVTMVLQCSGNGRAYFDHDPSGTQWQLGAAGNVMWTGVPLRSIVEALGGVAEGAEYVTGTGGEELPEGIDPLSILVERSVPLEAMEDILLAWDINGEPISLAHGGPLRMVVPGYTGVNNVKYIKKIAFTEEESPARIQQTRYRLMPVGEEGGPQWPSVWKMDVKSWITGPLDNRGAGPVLVTGVAFGGTTPVDSVEVSVDGGETWHQADFVGPDLGRFAWRPFVLAVDLEPGNYMLVSRATDSEGNSQPENFEPNQSGYSHNGWRAPGVEIAVS